jgi:hypothetical protein
MSSEAPAAPATPVPPRQATFQEIMEKSAKSALHGGVAGAAAMGANVAALMWIRTTVRTYIDTDLLKEKEEKGNDFVLALCWLLPFILFANVVERNNSHVVWPCFCIRHPILRRSITNTAMARRFHKPCGLFMRMVVFLVFTAVFYPRWYKAH